MEGMRRKRHMTLVVDKINFLIEISASYQAFSLGWIFFYIWISYKQTNIIKNYNQQDPEVFNRHLGRNKRYCKKFMLINNKGKPKN